MMRIALVHNDSIVTLCQVRETSPKHEHVPVSPSPIQHIASTTPGRLFSSELLLKKSVEVALKGKCT